MPILKIKGWDTGRNQVAMIELLEQRLGMYKTQSEELANAIHNGKVISLNFDDAQAAQGLAEELIAVGAKVSIDD